MSETLLLLDPRETSITTLRSIPGLRVVQEFGPHAVTVAGTEQALSHATTRAGVASVDSSRSALPAFLGEGETLLVQAWLSGRTPKERELEAKSWGHFGRGP